jgi:hypothetical protein
VPTLTINAEESEAATRKYCEGFTARIGVCEFTMCPLNFGNAARQAVPCADLTFADESAPIPLHESSSVYLTASRWIWCALRHIKLFDTLYLGTVMKLAVQGVRVL